VAKNKDGTMEKDNPINYSQRGDTEYNKFQWISGNDFCSYCYVPIFFGKMN
jgi:hypothetical protein